MSTPDFVQITVRIPRELLAFIDARAETLSATRVFVNRADVVREMLGVARETLMVADQLADQLGDSDKDEQRRAIVEILRERFDAIEASTKKRE
jgi:Arc/MetJ-type ribon-helix-helix transcriptional regulator